MKNIAQTVALGALVTALSGCFSSMPPECASSESTELLASVVHDAIDTELKDMNLEMSFAVLTGDAQTTAVDEKLKRRTCQATVNVTMDPNGKAKVQDLMERIKKENDLTSGMVLMTIGMTAGFLKNNGVDENTTQLNYEGGSSAFTLRMGEGKDKGDYILETNQVDGEWVLAYLAAHLLQK